MELTDMHPRRLAGLTVTVLLLMFARAVSATVEADEAQCQPQHVHLAWGDSVGVVTVVWATQGPCSTEVAYGTGPWAVGQSVSGTSHSYTDHNQHGLAVLHRAMITGLKESTTYFYKPTSNSVGKGPFYFKTPSAGQGWSPELLVVGDLGDDLSLLPALTQGALSGHYSAALQLGGLSHYLSDVNGTKGDNLMEGLEAVAAFLPYMTAPGHNETQDGKFPGYRNRFSMPGSVWPIPENKLWYSFDLGPAHFISYSTDIYLLGDTGLQNEQNDWLVRDLNAANKARATRPWIVAFGRDPLYCSDVESTNTPTTQVPSSKTPTTTSPLHHHHHPHDCAQNVSLVRTGLEETLYYYGVDLILQSHAGSYERLFPLFKGVVLAANFTNPPAPVQIVMGRASDTFHVAPTASTPPTAAATATNNTSDSAENTNTTTANDINSSSKTSKTNVVNGTAGKSETAERFAFRMIKGTQPTYGRLQIVNATHAHWELLAGVTDGDRKSGDVLDSLWLVQEHHGKFQLSDLPDEVEKKIDHNLVAAGGKPGVLNVDDPERETKSLLAWDGSRRLIIGASFGAFVLVLVVVVVVVRLRRRGQRRVARRWDSMDYKYGKTKLYTPTNDEEDDEYEDFKDDNDFEIDIPDGTQQTAKLINGK